MTSDDIKSTAKDMAGDAGQFARKASETVSDKARDLKGSARDAGSDLGDHASTMADKVSDAASNLYGRASDTLSKAAGSFPDTVADAMAKSQRALGSGGDQVVAQVKKQPLEALLLAAAIGYLVGWASNRG